MVMIDVIYDAISGVLGTVFGVFVTLWATRGRTRRTENMLQSTQVKLDALADENLRLIGALRDKENTILELEKKILATEAAGKSSAKKSATKRKKSS